MSVVEKVVLMKLLVSIAMVVVQSLVNNIRFLVVSYRKQLAHTVVVKEKVINVNVVNVMVLER